MPCCHSFSYTPRIRALQKLYITYPACKDRIRNVKTSSNYFHLPLVVSTFQCLLNLPTISEYVLFYSQYIFICFFFNVLFYVASTSPSFLFSLSFLGWPPFRKWFIHIDPGAGLGSSPQEFSRSVSQRKYVEKLGSGISFVHQELNGTESQRTPFSKLRSSY